MKVKRLCPEAVLPSYAHDGDSGLDLHAAAEYVIGPGETALVATGIAISLPPGTEGQVRARSGLALRHQLAVLNGPGTIDCGYRGEIKVILMNLGQEPFRINPGDRIAQLVIAPVLRAQVEEVEELDDTARGEGGFGSSGR